jgi:hypothetical protein
MPQSVFRTLCRVARKMARKHPWNGQKAVAAFPPPIKTLNAVQGEYGASRGYLREGSRGREGSFAGGAEAGAPGRPQGGRDEGRRRRARALGPAPRARFPGDGSEDKKRPAGRSRERGISLPAGCGEESLLPATWIRDGRVREAAQEGIAAISRRRKAVP